MAFLCFLWVLSCTDWLNHQFCHTFSVIFQPPPHLSGHANHKHPWPHQAPQLTRFILPRPSNDNLDKMEVPFHASRKSSHHLKSEWNDALSLTWWWSSRMPARSLKRHLRNNRPGLTTFQACCSFPTKDCNSLFQHDFRPSHSPTRLFNSSIFFWDKCSSSVAVSTSMPRKVTLWLGPSSFSAAKGNPSSSKTANRPSS